MGGGATGGVDASRIARLALYASGEGGDGRDTTHFHVTAYRPLRGCVNAREVRDDEDKENILRDKNLGQIGKLPPLLPSGWHTSLSSAKPKMCKASARGRPLPHWKRKLKVNLDLDGEGDREGGEGGRRVRPRRRGGGP